MALRTAVAALALLGSALAQYSGWEDEVVNATMCTWRLPRSKTVLFLFCRGVG